jgi:hypothetical protein
MCATYFRPGRNPYRRWFDTLDSILRTALGVSYYDGTACHLDLVQWATNPVWAKLPVRVKELLLEESLPHLRCQLRFGNVRLVVLNGRQVLNQVRRVRLANLERSGAIQLRPTVSCQLYSGDGESARFLGWSTNLQSSYGVSGGFKDEVARWLAEAAEFSETHTDGNQPMSQLARASGVHGHVIRDGYVVKGIVLTGKGELLRLLEAWLEISDALNIGSTEYGQTPWIFITLNQRQTAVLNADTKRAAVEEYVKDAQARGADVSWWVIRNRRGSWNKLAFRADHMPTPGWYCYLRPTTIGPEEV